MNRKEAYGMVAGILVSIGCFFMVDEQPRTANLIAGVALGVLWHGWFFERPAASTTENESIKE